MEKGNRSAKLKEGNKSFEYLIAAGGILLLLVVIGVCFDYYYCVNDDTTLRDILCGSYTGVPESRNIQMLYPVSALFSLFYKLFPALPGGLEIPWYGICLCICQYGALFLIAARAAGFVNRKWMKGIMVAGTLLFAGNILLYELVYVQYTMTCAILMAAAVFWFYTTDATKSVKSFLTENIVSILLVVLAFQIRTEMAILLFPFLLGAGLCKWSKEKKFFTKENIVKYLGIIGAALALMGGSLLADRLAYGTEEWQRFRAFFDYRTEIYDFLGWPDYETNQEFYEEAGLSQAEAVLIDNYNFALDESIDEEVLRKMVDYQTGQRGGDTLFLIDFREAVWLYGNSLLSTKYMPYSGLVLFLYLLLMIVAIYNRDKSYLWKLPMFVGIRSVCWMYIILRNRTPDRITHGLFWMELMMLFGLLAVEWGRKKISRVTVSVLACVILALSLPSLWSRALGEGSSREKINEEWLLLQEYCKENAENYYVIDVYSTVNYTEKMFEGVDNSYRNYDLCGGWTSKSPLYGKKLLQRDITDLEKALVEKENVFFVSKVNRDVEWLTEYYKQKGIAVTAENVGKIELNGEVRFVIYRLL